MKSLPTAVSTANLNAMLATIEKLPSAVVSRIGNTVTVHATKRATGDVVKVLSAISADGKNWSVRAVPGLITPV